jgi:transglutaminase-like putative cysteine protease
MWGRARASISGAVIWSAVITALLTLVVAQSTATAGWVDGIGVVPMVALGGALLMGLLAVAPVPWPAALGVGFVAGPVVAAIAAWPTVHATHPFDALSVNLIGTWGSRIANGNAEADPAFYLYLICLLMWVTGGWLSWCVLRWRKPMLGLVPGAAAFATNLLNSPFDQNGYTLAILVLTLALLLWTNYTSSIANATRARVKLTGDARWDFWESGLVAMAALIVLAIMLPPLSTVDRTVSMESGVFSSWAQLQQRLGNPTAVGSGLGAGTTGFSTEVNLTSGLKKTRDVVFTYTYTPNSGPIYFRGVNLIETQDGQWRYAGANMLQAPITKDTIPPYTEDYLDLALTPFTIKMVSPPANNSDILFYPGTLYRADRDSIASESIPPLSLPTQTPDLSLETIDRLSSVKPSTSAGTYNVTVEYSTATEAELRQAGTNYPDWLSSYSSLPASGYRPYDTLARIKQLALSVTKAAGAVNPYDEAKAIETYLRSPIFTYTLTPPVTPVGADPIDFFLFHSKQGYCEFFATAMGDMLRSLGIPTRLVNGFGPGTYDSAYSAFVVRGEDAHTWVESYFPDYGWITFEPTNDSVYHPFTPGSNSTNPCLRDTGCDVAPGTGPGGVVDPTTQPGIGPGVQPNAPPGSGSGFTLHAPDAVTLTRIIGVLLALMLLAFGAAARYLRPRSVTNVWRRTLVLARLAGAERRIGETPLELGRRLAHAFPEASQPVRLLADGFVVSAYAPPDLAEAARASVMEAWSSLRPLLLRRVASRLRRSRA